MLASLACHGVRMTRGIHFTADFGEFDPLGIQIH
jgi:hypothetical protein